jgi:hypothetical protein
MKNWWRTITGDTRTNQSTSEGREVESNLQRSRLEEPLVTQTTIQNLDKGVSMSFKSILDAIGHSAEAVLHFMGSQQGQTAVGLVETGIEIYAPAATGAINIFNKFATEAVKVQALGVAAGATAGSNTQKAAAVIGTVGPEAIAFARANGLQDPTASDLQEMNDLAVKFMNLWKPKATAAPTGNIQTQIPASTATPPVGVAPSTLPKVG